MLKLWVNNLPPVEWTLAEGHLHMVNGREVDLWLLQVEALGMTGFEVAAWLELCNIFLELATREVRLPYMVSDSHYMSCCRAWDTARKSGTVSDASAGPDVYIPRRELTL